MKKLEFKSGTIETYETKEEMIDILSSVIGENDVMDALMDERYKDIFNPHAERNYYIKKIVAIKVPNEKTSLMCMEHWNYTENTYYDKGWKIKEENLNIDTYSSGFAWISFRRPQKEKQNCFMEYYNTVRDDERIEQILNTFKDGDKIYFMDDKNVLSSETVNYVGFDCEDCFAVELGTKERKDKFGIFRIKENKSCETFGVGKFLYPSLEAVREHALKELQEKKNECKKRLNSIEKRILDAMSFVG